MLVVCVCVEHGDLCEHAQTAFVLTGTLKVAAFCIVDAAKLFLCSYRTFMFQSVRILDVKVTAICR